jgi:hypothetical protein
VLLASAILLAGTAGSPADPGALGLAQYGAIGVLLMAAIGALAKAYAREVKRADENSTAAAMAKAYEREAARADELAGKVESLNAWIRDSAVPALVAATQANKDHAEVDRDLLSELRGRRR